jgi:hypothetical protein
LKKINKKKTTKQKMSRNLFPCLNKISKLATVTSQTIHIENTNIDNHSNEEMDNEIASDSNFFNSVVETGCCTICDTGIKNSDLGVECSFCNIRYHQRCAKNTFQHNLYHEGILFIYQHC